MSLDDVKEALKEDSREGELVAFVPPTMTDLRREAETIQPIPPKRGPLALLRSAGTRMDWRRLPGLRPAQEEKPLSYAGQLFRRIGLFVLLPTAVVAVYLFAIASDQYVASAQFAVRGNVEPMEHASLGQFTALIQKHNSQDGYIVRDYIQSQAMVEELERSIHISRMFSRPEADFWARFDPRDPVEELTKYWRKQVSADIDAISGVIRLNVRAFTPQDAFTIAREVVARSEVLINDISKRAQADMVAQAKADAATAEDRLRKAHLAVQTFRNKWGLIDPVKTAEGTLTTLTLLRKEKIKLDGDLQVLRSSNLDERSRSIQTLVAQVAALDQQMKILQDEMTSSGPTADGQQNLTEALLAYEGLVVERTIAEKLEESAHVLYDRARISAAKQQIFLATFERPVLPTESLYPERGRTIFVMLFCFIVMWSSFTLVKAGIRDQRS
ncbi:capsule biosynthesis protein [Methylobacterium sp. J-076]|uniref:capsule biosynthesis protein n=1 Tax=Methylobacterium sp. J-076 TaxID=2836655 RepID=UPI001FBAB3FE|nr:capsule biosynthesis protein [Methylobacterium sp. J-076]MCJ2011393.1 capsule biosynthesis protein [Methylobacterium sp. J-076]